MSDTPETDAAERMAYSQEYMVPTDFARKLERERDEARKYLKWIHDVADSQRKWNFRTLAKEGLTQSMTVK